MNNYLYVKELAEKLLDIALKYDELDKFITGYPGYEVTVNDGIGNKVNSIDAIMQSIYKKYGENSSITEHLYTAIAVRINSTKNGETLLYLIDMIKYQMREEKANTAPFKINCIELLDLVKENIIRNRDIYNRPFKTHINGFMEDFKIAANNLELTCGYVLL